MDLSNEAIFGRICVRDPYFALTELARSDEGVSARVRAEQPLGGERGPIAAAEAGRHLAILGSCAAALVNPADGRHFYLARKALIVRQAGADEVPSDTILRARARASFSGRRAEATAWLEGPSGQPVHRLEVEYSVLSEPVFARLFRQARVDMRHAPREGNSDESAKAARTNPYADPLPTTPIELGAEGARATIPSVAPLLCKGHFPLYPTLPVAIVMRALSDLAGAHLRASRGHASHTVLAAEVHAETLANAGQDVTFVARPDPAAQGVYQCTATAGAGRTVGTMRLTLASA